MQKMTLYQLTADIEALLEELNTALPETEDEAMAMYDELYRHTAETLTANLDDKIEGYVYIIKSVGTYRDAVKAERQRLQRIEKSLDAKKDKMKDAVLHAMQTLEMDKVKAGHFTVAVQNSAPRLVVHNDNAVPAAYWIDQAPKRNDAAIKDALKGGVLVADENIYLEQGQHLRIR